MTYDFTSAENKVIIHINQGLILGDYNNDRNRLLAKTFVSKEMLFDSQVSVDNEVAEMRDLDQWINLRDEITNSYLCLQIYRKWS